MAQKSFDWKEHILKYDYDLNISELERKLEGSSIFSLIPLRNKILRLRMERLKDAKKNNNILYHHLGTLFEGMEKEGRDITYFEGNHVIKISGDGIETIQMEGNPDYKNIDGRKCTHLDVIIGDEKQKIRLYDWLHMDTIPGFTNLELRYWFNTNFSLAYCRESMISYSFTKKPFKDNKKIDDFEDYFFYGEPGRVHLRDSLDALTRELRQSICHNVFMFPDKKDRLDLQGELYYRGQNKPFYVGKIETGAHYFPYFIFKDPDKHGEREIANIPSAPDKVPLLI